MANADIACTMAAAPLSHSSNCMLQQCFETWTMLIAGGSPYAVIAILDTIAVIKPNVATVAFGLVASTATVLLVS